MIDCGKDESMIADSPPRPNHQPPPTQAPFALILAGGRARRMGGGDKGLQMVGGRTIFSRIFERIAPQAARITINANGDISRLRDLGLEIIPDTIPDYAGPLAGVLAGLDWMAKTHPGKAHLLTVPCDCPFLPRDLAAKLVAARNQSGLPLACAHSGDFSHPAIALWPVDLREDLRKALRDEQLHKVQLWQRRHGCAEASWPVAPFDPFLNVNHPDDVARANIIAEQWPDA